MNNSGIHDPDEEIKSGMREMLKSIGLIPIGLTSEDMERLSTVLMAQHGTPDTMIVSESIYETLKNIRFNSHDLKP